MYVSSEQLRDWAELILDQYVSETNPDQRRRLTIALHEIGEILNPTVPSPRREEVYI